MTQTYGSKSSAAKGAKRANVFNPIIEQNAEGRWTYAAQPEIIETPKKDKGPTKKSIVLDMVRADGASIADIAAALNVSNVAARSLIGDLKKADFKVVSEKHVYKLAA